MFCRGVITQPVIGKLSQVGAERVVGTILGGVLGFCVFEIGEKFWTQRSVARGDEGCCWPTRLQHESMSVHVMHWSPASCTLSCSKHLKRQRLHANEPVSGSQEDR